MAVVFLCIMYNLEPVVVIQKFSTISRAYNTMCYSADGKCVLAGGRSKNVCIYSVHDQLLIKKFEITCNLSLDGTVVRTTCTFIYYERSFNFT